VAGKARTALGELTVLSYIASCNKRKVILPLWVNEWFKLWTRRAGARRQWLTMRWQAANKGAKHNVNVHLSSLNFTEVLNRLATLLAESVTRSLPIFADVASHVAVDFQRKNSRLRQRFTVSIMIFFNYSFVLRRWH